MTSDVEMTVCEPPAILPAQVSGGARWDADTSGPRALVLAHFHARRLAAEAAAWVRCDRREWPFSRIRHGRRAHRCPASFGVPRS